MGSFTMDGARRSNQCVRFNWFHSGIPIPVIDNWRRLTEEGDGAIFHARRPRRILDRDRGPCLGRHFPDRCKWRPMAPWGSHIRTLRSLGASLCAGGIIGVSMLVAFAPCLAPTEWRQGLRSI